MKKFNLIIDAQYINGHDLVLTVNHENKLNRVYFITDEGISRHVDKQNLHDCLHSIKLFDRDAFFFMKEKAISTCQILLECKILSENIEKYLKDKLKIWKKEV